MADHSSEQDRMTQRSVTVSASGMVAARPDIAHVSVGVITEAATARDALDANSTAMKALIDGLKSLGIDDEDVRTTQIGVQPRYPSARDGQPPVIAGYQVTNQVEIVARDIDRLGEVLDRTVLFGANQLGGIRFEVSNAETLLDEARRQAMDNARRRAELYAAAAGEQLGGVLAISEAGASPGPRTMLHARAAMAESVPIEPGSLSLRASVQVTWALA